MSELGPLYGVELIDDLPLRPGKEGGMRQQMPSCSDLQGVKNYRQGQRVVAGYEVLLNHWREQCYELERLQAIVAKCSAGLSAGAFGLSVDVEHGETLAEAMKRWYTEFDNVRTGQRLKIKALQATVAELQEEVAFLKRCQELRRVNTADYRAAPSGEGPHADTWNDKPHRLLYDVCHDLDVLQAIVDKLPKCWQFNADKTGVVYDYVIIRPTVAWILGGITPRREETNGSIEWAPSVALIGGGFVDGSACYNTLEAAEFAQRKEQGGWN